MSQAESAPATGLLFAVQALLGSLLLGLLVQLLLPHCVHGLVQLGLLSAAGARGAGGLVVRVCLFHSSLGLLALWLYRRGRALPARRFTVPALLGFLLASVVLVLGVGPLANAVALGLTQLLGAGTQGVDLTARTVRQATPGQFWVLLGAVAVLPACVEETLFRGVLQRALAGAGPRLALLGQAVAFGLFHLDLAQGLATMLLGLVFGTLRLLSGRLLPSMLAHAAYNTLVLLSLRGGSTTQVDWRSVLPELLGGLLVAALGAAGLHAALRAAPPEST